MTNSLAPLSHVQDSFANLSFGQSDHLYGPLHIVRVVSNIVDYQIVRNGYRHMHTASLKQYNPGRPRPHR